MGQKLMDFVAILEATDARTITLKLKEPYGLVLELIGKPSSLVPFMMPKRLAETPPGQQIKEQIGSGPFKFVAAEFQPGMKSVYVKNTDYVPRKEPASWTSGGKVVKVDRVQWITMPDAQTAVNALQSGDIDFMEDSALRPASCARCQSRNQGRHSNKLGVQTLGRMNFLYPPFDNVKVRRAALLAMNQKDVLDALVGNPEYYRICGAVFVCGTPLASDVGSETLVKGNGMAEANKQLAEFGYDGTPVVVMAPGDVVTLKAQPIVAGAIAARGRLQGRCAGDRLADCRDPSRQPEAAEGGRLEHVLHQLGRRRRRQSRRQSVDQRQGQEWRLVRLAGRSQDGIPARCVRAFLLARGAEKARRGDPEGELRPGDLYPARPISCAERLAQITHGRP